MVQPSSGSTVLSLRLNGRKIFVELGTYSHEERQAIMRQVAVRMKRQLLGVQFDERTQVYIVETKKCNMDSAVHHMRQIIRQTIADCQTRQKWAQQQPATRATRAGQRLARPLPA